MLLNCLPDGNRGTAAFLPRPSRRSVAAQDRSEDPHGRAQHEKRRAHRFALDAGLVLCDRYPHPRLVSMDVPRIPTMPNGKSQSRIVTKMVDLEKLYHRTILPPDILVVLKLDPKIAAARKTDESPESVQRRGTEIWNVDWAGLGIDVVDASQSQEAVALELKVLVWSALG